MEEGLKFYRCNTCGNMMLVMIDPDMIPTCCGSSMQILSSQRSMDGAETHAPIIELKGDHTDVSVGMREHPMKSDHRVEWIALTDGSRVEIQKLGLVSRPVASFSITKTDGKLRAYSFCNIHGLWSSEK